MLEALGDHGHISCILLLLLTITLILHKTLLIIAVQQINLQFIRLKQQTHFSWFCVLAGCTHPDQLDQRYMAPDDLMHT